MMTALGLSYRGDAVEAGGGGGGGKGGGGRMATDGNMSNIARTGPVNNTFLCK